MRTRLIAVITVVAALGMVAVGFVVYLEERDRILRQVDDLLVANLAAGRDLVENPVADEPWGNAQEALAAVVQRAAPDDNTGVVGIVDGAASLVPGVALDVDLLQDPAFIDHVVGSAEGGEPVVGTYAENGHAWRYLAMPVTVESTPEPSALFVIAYDVHAELAEINSAARVWLIASAATLVVIAIAAGWVTTRLLAPLRQMRETAQRVSGQSMSERIPIVGRDDVSELARTMNDMLDRLDEALESQRRLLSDVGHELKTPITIVRGYVEVVDPDDPEDVRATRDLAVDELERMDRLVQDLASAASLHGPVPVKPVLVDAADLLRQVVRKAQGIGGGTIRAGDLAEVVTELDPSRITQALLQLTQNAVTHGGGEVEISSTVAEDRLRITVRDFGRGVPDDEKPRIFDRFHRGTDAEDPAGSGLGLNIVQVIARAHTGSVGVDDAPGGGAAFTVSIPLVRGQHAPGGLIIPPRPPAPAATTVISD